MITYFYCCQYLSTGRVNLSHLYTCHHQLLGSFSLCRYFFLYTLLFTCAAANLLTFTPRSLSLTFGVLTRWWLSPLIHLRHHYLCVQLSTCTSTVTSYSRNGAVFLPASIILSRDKTTETGFAFFGIRVGTVSSTSVNISPSLTS